VAVAVICFILGAVLAIHAARKEENQTQTLGQIESLASNQSMEPTAPLQNKFSVIAATPCRGFSLFRWAKQQLYSIEK
jgi:hypothetical protein